MQCPYCHEETGENKGFCPQCGQPAENAAVAQNTAEPLRNLLTKISDSEPGSSSSALSGIRQAMKQDGKSMKIPYLITAGLSLAALAAMFLTVVIPLGRYNHAKELAGDAEYEEAITLCEKLGDYKDAKSLKQEYSDAFMQQKYDNAVQLFQAQQYSDAVAAFTALGGYRDADSYLKQSQAKVIETIPTAAHWDFTKQTEELNGQESAVQGDVQIAETGSSGIPQAANFDGNGDYLACGKGLNIDREAGWTLSAAFSCRDVSKKYAGIFTKYETSGAGAYALSVKEGYLNFILRLDSGEQVELQSSTPLENGRWYHAAAIVQGAEMRIYLDGSLEASIALNGYPLQNEDTVTIGRQALLHSPDQLQFNGMISDIAVYPQALSDVQLSMLARLRLGTF